MEISLHEWHWIAAVAAFAPVAGMVVWVMTRHRPTADEIEQARREKLVWFGRLVDGLLVDNFAITRDGGETRSMLLYSYEIAGVNYECSQDITALRSVLDPEQIRVGLPCSIRYQPGSPENSIVMADSWCGLRETVTPTMHSPESDFIRRHSIRPRKKSAESVE